MTNSNFKRLYVLKGRVGLIGKDNIASISFVLPWKGSELRYFNLTFTPEELNLKPEKFLYLLKEKVKNLSFDWIKYVRTADKKGDAS